MNEWTLQPGCSFQTEAWQLKTGGSDTEAAKIDRHFSVMEHGKWRNLFLVGKIITAVCIQGGEEAGRSKEVNSLETFIP